jgi:uncharacterized metal-binding protein
MTERDDVQSSGVPPAETAQALFQLITGFRVTQMIHVVAKLGMQICSRTARKARKRWRRQRTHMRHRSTGCYERWLVWGFLPRMRKAALC